MSRHSFISIINVHEVQMINMYIFIIFSEEGNSNPVLLPWKKYNPGLFQTKLDIYVAYFIPNVYLSD